MSQNDLSIANAAGSTVRADINSALQAQATDQSGTAAPGTTYAYQKWVDATNNVRKRRNAANSVWLLDPDALAEDIVQAKTANYTAALSDHGTLIDATSNSWTLSLTAAATLGDGWWIALRNSGSGIITVDPNSTEQIDGATTIKLYPGESCWIYCDGAAFKTVGRARGWVLLESQSAAAAATIDFTTALDDSFDDYMLMLSQVKPATDDVALILRIGTGGGPTWQSGAGAYAWGGRINAGSGAGDANSGASGLTSGIWLTNVSGAGQGIGNAAGEHFSGRILFSNPEASDFPLFNFESRYMRPDSTPGFAHGGGSYLTAGAITGVRLVASSGNITSGLFRLYGLRK